MHTHEITVLEDAAQRLGAEHGRSGASWVFDGNTTSETYARCLELDEEGAPEWHDIFGPTRSPLSGEYADDLTPDALLEAIGAPEPDGDAVESWADLADQTAFQDEICMAYEDAYYEAWADEVLRMARAMV